MVGRVITSIKYFLLLFFLFPYLQAFSFNNESITPPPGIGPLEIAVSLHINKIYNVNSVNETYDVDGYLVYTWQDDRLIFKEEDSLTKVLIYENERALELIKSEIWIPAFELINIQGGQETQNLQIRINADGKIVYNLRFFGVFHTEMNFKRFPFDSKIFVIQIESFSYNNKALIFKELDLFPTDSLMDDKLGEDWELISTNTNILSETYAHLNNKNPNNDEDTFSRAVFAVHAKRLSGYYLWQVLLPLLVIILASFTVYWIRDFGTQIGIGFTLMLTVVAFNFYSVSILPKLPYNTFIEYVIIVGYIFILLGIIAVTINHNLTGLKNKKYDLLTIFRYLIPLSYLLIMIVLCLKFFTN